MTTTDTMTAQYASPASWITTKLKRAALVLILASLLLTAIVAQLLLFVITWIDPNDETLNEP